MREAEPRKTLGTYASAQRAEEALGDLYLLCGHAWGERALWSKPA